MLGTMPDMSRNFRLALLASLPLAAVLPGAQTMPADLVLTNGIVITVDPRDSVAEAVAVRGGKIVFVGTSARARAYVGEKTEVIDLHGRAATPGLIDTHVHFSEAADNLDLGDARSMADVIGVPASRAGRRARAAVMSAPARRAVRVGADAAA